MKMWKLIVPVAVILLFAGQAVAQTGYEESRRDYEASEVQYTEQLKEAEAQMAEAARWIAELTSERLPRLIEIERRFEYSNKPRIGITIDGADDGGPVEGVLIEGVTPGSAAEDAGLRAGDILTAVNDESLSAETSAAANKRLLDFMQGVEEGDQLAVEYLRNGNVGSVEVAPRIMEMHMFSWMPGADTLHGPGAAFAPHAVQKFTMQFGFPWAGRSWHSMELIELNAGLGKYFGTDTGLLVVSAPKSDALELQDGDVIQSIDGREPTDIRHAMRILSSYKSGEKLKLGIMRDKKKRTLNVQIPEENVGMLFEELLQQVRPARVPVAPRAPKAPPEFATT